MSPNRPLGQIKPILGSIVLLLKYYIKLDQIILLINGQNENKHVALSGFVNLCLRFQFGTHIDFQFVQNVIIWIFVINLRNDVAICDCSKISH